MKNVNPDHEGMLYDIIWTVWAAALVALIPGAVWLFFGLLVDGATWFANLSWNIKIPIYLVLGFFLQKYARNRNKRKPSSSKGAGI